MFVSVCCEFPPSKICSSDFGRPILEDPGEVSRVGRRFQARRKSPGYQLSPNHFRTAKRMLAPDWAPKMLCITVLCPIGEQHLLSPFRVFVHNGYSLLPYISSSFTKVVGARQTFILYFPNQKRRNYQWLWETFRMLSEGTFQFAPAENSVSDRPQRFVSYGYPGALPPMLRNFCRSFSSDPADFPRVSEDGTDR